MCADIAIHDTDGHNPHAHIMLTIRPLDDKGKWQPKTQKEYLCVKDGTEQGFTADEFKTAQSDGWEKQYQYFVGKKKIYMPPSQAKELERVNKYPKSTKYGRQNPICERWNSEEQLELWRKNWADIANKYMERLNLDSRIDHRSHAERGIDEQPTIHEGVSARIMENKGFPSERCEINRQIKADNKLLRELKAQLKKLINAAKRTVSAIAKVLETLRKDMIYYRYNIEASKLWTFTKKIEVDVLKGNVEKYTNLADEIRAKMNERKALTKQRDNTPKYQIFKHRELTKQINDLSEQIEELLSSKKMLLENLDCEEDKDIKKVNFRISDIEDALEQMKKHTDNCKNGIKTALQEFDELYEQTADMDTLELIQERLSFRPRAEQEAETELKTAYKDRFSRDTFKDSITATDKELQENLYAAHTSIVRELKRLQREQNQQEQRPRHHDREDDWDMEL